MTQWTVCSTSGSFVHRTSQARILECVDFSFSRGSSNPGVKLLLLHWQVDSLSLSRQGSPCYFPIWCKLCWSLCMHACSVMSHCLWSHELQPTRLHWPWDFSGKNTRVGGYFLLQLIFPTQGSNLHFLHWQVDSLPLSQQGRPCYYPQFSSVTQSCLILSDPMDCTAYQVPPSVGFSRQEYWSGLPLPSPVIFLY